MAADTSGLTGGMTLEKASMNLGVRVEGPANNEDPRVQCPDSGLVKFWCRYRYYKPIQIGAKSLKHRCEEWITLIREAPVVLIFPSLKVAEL